MLPRLIQKKVPRLPPGVSLPPCPVMSLEHIYHAPGQAAAIRFFDPDSASDLATMREILKASEVKKWMDEPYLSKADYRDWAGSATNSLYLFAVLDARVADLAAIDLVRGFVFIYSEREEKFRVKRLQRFGLLKTPVREQYNLEISFAAKPILGDVPKSSGLISSAIRQSCLEVQLLLNSRSRPEINIFAFVDPKNQAAQRTLEAAGFILRGRMKYDRDSPGDSFFYLLSWRLLNRKIRKRLLELQEQPGQ